MNMPAKKGRAVTPAERPTYDSFHQLMTEGRIFFWSVPAKDDWIVWVAESDFGTIEARKAGTDGGYRTDLAGAKRLLAILAPELAPEAPQPTARTNVATMRLLVNRLVNAIESDTVDDELLCEARAA